MSNPTPDKNKEAEEEYVSPTSDETLAERYERLQAEEAAMKPAELLAKLRERSVLFDDLNSEDEAESEAKD